MNRCHLKKVNLSRARLGAAHLASTTFDETSLRGADLTEACFFADKLTFHGTEVEYRGQTIIDADTYRLSAWDPQFLHAAVQRGLAVTGKVLFPRDAQVILNGGRGLLLTFDSRLHRFDATALDLLVLAVLGPETDVTIVERSPMGEDGPGWIRIDGLRAEDLIAVAEAFYDRVWETSREDRGEKVEMGLVLNLLQDIRGKVDGLVINHPDVREMLAEQAEAHAHAPVAAALRTRFQRVGAAIAEEVKVRTVVPLLGDAGTTALLDAVSGLATDAGAALSDHDNPFERRLLEQELQEAAEQGTIEEGEDAPIGPSRR
jgi:hypothetical protein